MKQNGDGLWNCLANRLEILWLNYPNVILFFSCLFINWMAVQFHKAPDISAALRVWKKGRRKSEWHAISRNNHGIYLVSCSRDCICSPHLCFSMVFKISSLPVTKFLWWWTISFGKLTTSGKCQSWPFSSTKILKVIFIFRASSKSSHHIVINFISLCLLNDSVHRRYYTHTNKRNIWCFSIQRHLGDCFQAKGNSKK